MGQSEWHFQAVICDNMLSYRLMLNVIMDDQQFSNLSNKIPFIMYNYDDIVYEL